MTYRDILTLVEAGQCVVIVPVVLDDEEFWIAAHWRADRDARRDVKLSDRHMAGFLVGACLGARAALKEVASL